MKIKQMQEFGFLDLISDELELIDKDIYFLTPDNFEEDAHRKLILALDKLRILIEYRQMVIANEKK